MSKKVPCCPLFLALCRFQQPERAPYKGAEVSRGSRVMAVKLIMLDESENKILDAGKNEVCLVALPFH